MLLILLLDSFNVFLIKSKKHTIKFNIVLWSNPELFSIKILLQKYFHLLILMKQIFINQSTAITSITPHIDWINGFINKVIEYFTISFQLKKQAFIFLRIYNNWKIVISKIILRRSIKIIFWKLDLNRNISAINHITFNLLYYLINKI